MGSFVHLLTCGLFGSAHSDDPQSVSSTTPHSKEPIDLQARRSTGHYTNAQNPQQQQSGSPSKHTEKLFRRLTSRHRKRKSVPVASNGTLAPPTDDNLVGPRTEDFRIRDEDIAASMYAGSVASSMTRPHYAITNTSSAFQIALPQQEPDRAASPVPTLGSPTTKSPIMSPRVSVSIDRPRTDHVYNHALVVDTQLDRNFGF